MLPMSINSIRKSFIPWSCKCSSVSRNQSWAFFAKKEWTLLNFSYRTLQKIHSHPYFEFHLNSIHPNHWIINHPSYTWILNLVCRQNVLFFFAESSVAKTASPKYPIPQKWVLLWSFNIFHKIWSYPLGTISVSRNFHVDLNGN